MADATGATPEEECRAPRVSRADLDRLRAALEQDETLTAALAYAGSQLNDVIGVLVLDAVQAADAMANSPGASTKRALRAERTRLSNTLKQASQQLRAISPGIERLLIDVDPDPIDLADQIDGFAAIVERITPEQISAAPVERPNDVRARQAYEMALLVTRTLRQFGGKVTATHDGEYTSPAVRVLVILGDAISIRLAPHSWRDTLIEVLRSPDAQ